MRKQKSEYNVSPDEELDLKHQGSLGGQGHPKHGPVNVTGNITGMVEDTELAEIASSPSRAGAKQGSPEPAHEERSKQSQATKKHHYK